MVRIKKEKKRGNELRPVGIGRWLEANCRTFPKFHLSSFSVTKQTIPPPASPSPPIHDLRNVSSLIFVAR